ncbi:MAG TPA: hypothetical protein VIX58_06180 [Anaerolineae bacterium]
MTNRKSVRLPWALCAVVIGGALFSYVLNLNDPKTRADIFVAFNALLNALFEIAFGIVGALILSRLPGNRIGWLLMAIAISLSVIGSLQSYLEQIALAAAETTFVTYLLIWISGWSWWLLIGPLLLILLVFPTGRLLSPRWRWLVAMIAVLFIVFTGINTVTPVWQDPNTGKSVRNPLGENLIPAGLSFDAIALPFGIALVATAALCVLSVFVRYRRSAVVERVQLKWFLSACALFILVYPFGFFITEDNSPGWSGALFSVTILFLPVSIGIAILRYRLFDIDVIIRRTFIYSLVTAALALVYFGGVVILQQLFRSLTGAGDDLAIILSTLAIAALFNPLRHRIQDAIDRRFYRRKYDAQQVLAGFAKTARDETDLDKLAERLVDVVQETIQPKNVSVWIRLTPGQRKRE